MQGKFSMSKKKSYSSRQKQIYKASGYSEGGASLTDNALKMWQPRSYSPKSDIDENISILRDRSSDLAVNSPLGSAIINTMVSGIIGSGLKLFPVPIFSEIGMTADEAREWSRATQLKFFQWAESLDADFYRRNNFFELARIVYQSSISDGDCFCLFRRRFKNSGSSLCLQTISARRVSNPVTGGGYGLSSVEMLLPNGHKIVNGIETDRAGRLQAIHVSNKIWNEPTTLEPELKWQRVKMFGENGNQNALIISYDTRSEQFRGVPLLANCIKAMKQVARYSDAELSSAIIRTFFSLFFVQSQTNLDINQILPQEEEIDLRELKLGSGTLNLLPKNVDVKSVESQNAQKTFADFTNFFIKNISAAVGLPAEVVLKSYNASYSASRASLLQADQTFRERRAAFVNDFLQPVYQIWLAEMVASGQIQADGFFDDDFKKYCWSAADWRSEKMKSIDELKDANAAKVRIETGISSREIESTALGHDFNNICEQLKKESSVSEKGIKG